MSGTAAAHRASLPGRIAACLAAVSRETILLPVHLYRHLLSPILPPRCRYHPTCSTYAVHAVRSRGIVVGPLLAAWRVLRCNPWSLGGIDPVPPARTPRQRPRA